MSETGPWALPEGWRWSEVASLVTDISSGKSFKCDERPPMEGEVGVAKVSAVTWGKYDEKESKTCTRNELIDPELFIRKGDFLFSRANTINLVGSCVIVDHVTHDVMLSDKILRFTVSPGWERWLLWLLKSSHGRAEIERLATGNQESMRNIGQSRVLEIRLPLPPAGEHKRIVEAVDSYVSRLDDAVATLERVERKLKRYRASVLKSAVEGKLVPTEAELAKQEGRDYEPASVLLERILTERRRRWTESGKKGKYQEPTPPDTANLPALPEGWCWATVDQIAADVTYGSSSKTSEDLLSGVPVLRMGNIVDGYLDYSELKYLPLTHSEFPFLLLRPGDMLFNRTNSPELVGKTAVVERTELVSFASYLIRLRTFTDVDTRFVSYFINSPSGRAWIKSVVSQQVGQANVNGSKLKACLLPLPPRCEQVRIVDEVERLMSLTFNVAKQVESNLKGCARLRQSVLKWAFEGKLVDQQLFNERASVLSDLKAEWRGPAGKKRLIESVHELHSRGVGT